MIIPSLVSAVTIRSFDKVFLSTIRLWYRVASNFLGRFFKIPIFFEIISLVLPCTKFLAWIILDPKTFEATRYHSLIIDKKSLSKDLEITAETKDGLIMGVRHKKYHVHGVQFHPESIKTKIGIKILKNFIRI